MKASFTPGTVVRFNIPDGAAAYIEKYLGDGWYLISTIPEQRELIADEDDLILERRRVHANS